MLVPLVPLHHYSPDVHHHHMPTPSREESPLTAVAAAGSRSESPKRKYTEAMTLPSRLPRLNIDVPEIASDAYCFSEGKCDSPRSRVAERLEALDIDIDIDQAEDAPRKRVKIVEREPALTTKLSGFDVTPPKQPPRLRFDLDQNDPGAGPVLEIAETPGCRPEIPQSSTPSPLAKQLKSPMAKHPSPIVRITPTKRLRSPPPPLPTTTMPTSSPSPPNNPPSNLGPSPTSSQDSTTTTTWQLSEITGHEIHPSLGDDGEGINGIGFRPTPAIAQARSQKRKHQLSEWRAREAKEARQRRFEKRQGCAVDAAGGDEASRRVVRFEEIG